MDDVKCIACGKCCKKHWLLRLSKQEQSLFPEDLIVVNQFIYTDTCPHHINNKCNIHIDRPYKCKEYFCEGNLLK